MKYITRIQSDWQQPNKYFNLGNLSPLGIFFHGVAYCISESQRHCFSRPVIMSDRTHSLILHGIPREFSWKIQSGIMKICAVCIRIMPELLFLMQLSLPFFTSCTLYYVNAYIHTLVLSIYIRRINKYIMQIHAYCVYVCTYM